MPHLSSATSRSPAGRCSTHGESPFAGGLGGGGMATPTPDLHVTPPLGARSGLPLIPCPECGGGLVEEYVPAEGLCERCREDAVAHGGCSFFKTQEYEAILRDRGLLGPAGATPGQGQGGCHHLIPVPVGDPKMAAAVEDLKHELVALKDLKHELAALNLAIIQLTTDVSEGKLGAGDKVQKVAKTASDSIARWGKSIVKCFFGWFLVVILLSGIVSVK